MFVAQIVLSCMQSLILSVRAFEKPTVMLASALQGQLKQHALLFIIRQIGPNLFILDPEAEIALTVPLSSIISVSFHTGHLQPLLLLH